MATRAKTQKTMSRNGYQPCRPGEIVILAETDVLIGAPWMNDSWTSNKAFGVRAGAPTIIPRYALTARGDGATQLQAGKFKVIDATEGVIAPIVDVSDKVEREMWRDGKVSGPNRQELIASWRGIVADYSLAEAIVDCIQAGLDPDAAARELVRCYSDSFITHRAGSQPWLALSQQMIAAHKAREAGIA